MSAMRVSVVLNAVLDVLFPRRCPFCRKLLDGKRLICRDCAKSLPRVHETAQSRRYANIAECHSVLYYEGAVRESLLRYKFGGAAAYADAYAALMEAYLDNAPIDCDVVTWAPLSRKRLRRRGYDQARLLAEPVAEHLGVPCAQLLVKTRNNPAQSGTKGRDKRAANVSGVYSPAPGTSAAGLRVLLVDDIVTTGATLSECARVLKAAGADEIFALTLAMTRD